MCFEWRSANHQKWWATGVGTVLVAMAIVSTSFFRRWSSTEMHRSFDLIPGSESYNSWLQTTTPIYLSFYMFNWTNPNDIRNHSIKPKFVELGPYVYLEKHFKENLTYHDNGTVTYYERRTWHFDAVRSNGTENDMITTAHAITATVADEMRYQNQSVKKAINFMLNHEGGMLYTTKSVVEWIFKGFQDDLIDFLKHFNSTKINIPYKKFAWLADRNNSLEYDGAFTVHTGVVDISNVGLLTQWNRRNVTGFYPVPCGTVNGTMGDIFPPSMNTNEEVTVFVTDICRYMNLKPNGAIEHNGLTATEWVGTEETLDSGENYPNQQCFCDSKNEQCPKTGVVACKKCRYNAPIYASFPHFYLGDESYRSAVDGIKPDAAKHQFRLAVEPVTGIPVRVDGRVQMNMMITEDKDFDIYRGVQTFLMPLFWFDQSFALTQECATKAKQLANTIIANQYLHVAAYVFDSLFIIGIVVVVAENWYRTANADDSDDSDDDENMLTNDDESI